MPIPQTPNLDLSLRSIYNVNRGVRLGRWQLAAHRKTWHQAERGRRSGPDRTAGADIQHESEVRVLCYGRTRAGRLLTILYTERRGKTRVVTAYEMTKPQQKMYFEGNEHAQTANRNSEVSHRS
jgi:uncharacterized DUF497 family protein